MTKKHSMVNGKLPPLTQLLQQIADLVTSGDDSGSQGSDGSVPVRLRSVVLALLDQAAANNSGGWLWRGWFSV
jgi:hypothetical protein